MTTHLPECVWGHHIGTGTTNPTNWCICDRLRACEERMLNDDIPAAAYHGQKGYEIGYAAGLDAAREAVAAVEYWPTNPEKMIRSMALDAIDALRKERDD